MNPAPYILIIEDEAALVTLLRYNLERAGFEVGESLNGEEAMTAIAERVPDLVLLDWMLPSISGIEICRQLRRNPATRNLPIIMLTARSEEADRVRGLKCGADDYVTKPFSPVELIARINAVLRRIRPVLFEDTLAAGEVRMDLARHRVTRNDREVRLGPTEFRLLRHFLEHPDRVFSREQLLDAVWGSDIFVDPRTVDASIRRLRKTLNDAGESDLVRTVRAAGYAFESSAGTYAS